MSEKTYKDELKEIVEKFEKKELTKDQAFDQVIDIYKKEGTESAEDVNAALKKIGVGLSFQPGKQIITPEELMETTVGAVAAKANGYGMLDTGTGYMNKVKVVNGKLVNGAINQVMPDGSTNMYAVVYILDRKYEVKGDTLVD